MLRRRWIAPSVLAAMLVASCFPALGLPGIGGSTVPPAVGNPAGICDVLDDAHCLLPFPNDHFTVEDRGSATGRRVSLHPLATPTNVAGKPLDTTEWNRFDGFSPGSPILTRVPGLDLRRTWGIAGDQLGDLALSLRADSPIVLLDATTGERHPFWSELDTHAETTDTERLLIIRPARNLAEGHRYVVGLRRLRDARGEVIPPALPFRLLRDGRPAPAGMPHLEARRPAVGRALADLERAGVTRADLFLAWDFTVASADAIAGMVLHIRDDAFARLGDTDLGDGAIQGVSPSFTVDEVEDYAPERSRATARTVRGRIQVPNYLTPQHQASVELPPELSEALAPVGDVLGELPDPLGEAEGVVDDRSDQAVPGSRFLRGPDGLPVQNPVQPTVDVAFDCHLPRAGAPGGDGRADGLLYGHGLLGSRNEAGGSSTEDLRLRGFAVCAIDWWGMSFADIANVVSILVDVSNFPSMTERAQQGFLNWLFLGRALAHPDGFASHPAFRFDDGRPRIRTGSVVYDGNSQGGIMGGAVTALAPDFTRAKLGVPGMNYSTLLNRSVDWEGQYGAIHYAAYPDKIDQQINFALMQMLWDRAESNGYAQHMTSDPYPGTPTHQVMLQVAYADHQVANVAAEVMGRTVGATLRAPALGPASPHWSADPHFGLPPATYGPGGRGQSVLVYWFSADRDNTVPPNGNVPSESGGDPHSDPRKDNAASDQVAEWLRTGQLRDVCTGPCVTTEATRRN